MSTRSSPSEDEESEQQQQAGGRCRHSASRRGRSARQAQKLDSSVSQQLAVSRRAGRVAAVQLYRVSPEFLRLYQQQPLLHSFTGDQIHGDALTPLAPLVVQDYVRRTEQLVRQFAEGDASVFVSHFAESYTGRVHSSLPLAVVQAPHRGVSGFFAVMAALLSHFQYTHMDISVEPYESQSPVLARVLLKGRCTVRLCRSKREVTWPFVRYWTWDVRSEKVVASDFFEYDQELAEAFAAQEQTGAEQATAVVAITRSEQSRLWDETQGGLSAAVLQVAIPAVTVADSAPFMPLNDAMDAYLPVWDSRLRDGWDDLQLVETELPIGEGGEMDVLAASSFFSFPGESEPAAMYALPSSPTTPPFEAPSPGQLPHSAVIASVALAAPEPARPPPLLWPVDNDRAEPPPPSTSSSSNSSSCCSTSSSPHSLRVSESQSLCKLHRLLPDCERELPASVSGPGHRGIRCICQRCQLVCCVPSPDGSTPTMFRPFLVSTERALLLRLLILRDERKGAPALRAPKRRLADVDSSGSSSSSSPPSSRLAVRSRRRAQLRLNAQLKKIDVQGRRINRDRSISVAGSAGAANRELLAKRLTVHHSDAEEIYLYVFVSAQELETALLHWLALTRDLTAVQLLCHRLREAIVMKYHHAGQEIQIDRRQLQQLRAGDRQLIHSPSAAQAAQPDAATSSSSRSSLPPGPAAPDAALTVSPLDATD